MSADRNDGSTPHPLDYIKPDQVQDLWGIGYTIVKRARHPDPFHVPAEVIPQGRAYQWMHLVHDKFHYEHGGWATVPNSRHEGMFMPYGTSGAIEVNGLGLFEKPKFEVDAERANQQAAAHQQVADWAKKWGSDGISGSVSVGGVGMEVGEGEKVFKDVKAKTINTTVAFPKDMLAYAPHVFAERDRLYAELQTKWEANAGGHEPWQEYVLAQYHQAVAADPDILKGPTFNALLLPIAIENIRKQITEEANSGQTS